MFCGNCGKEIIGNTRFCPYCGEEQTATVIPAASVTSTPVSAVAAENTASVPAAASSGLAAPTTVTAPAVDTKIAVSAPSVPLVETVEIKDEEKPSPKLKYSLKHLVMCLVAAGVMAVAAGVFAGLYFSLYFS